MTVKDGYVFVCRGRRLKPLTPEVQSERQTKQNEGDLYRRRGVLTPDLELLLLPVATIGDLLVDKTVRTVHFSDLFSGSRCREVVVVKIGLGERL